MIASKFLPFILIFLFLSLIPEGVFGSSSSTASSATDLGDGEGEPRATALRTITATPEAGRADAVLHVKVPDNGRGVVIPSTQTTEDLLLRTTLLTQYTQEQNALVKTLRKAAGYVNLNPSHLLFGRINQIVVPTIEHLEDHNNAELLEMIEHLQGQRNYLIQIIQQEKNVVRNARSDPGTSFFQGPLPGFLPLTPNTRVKPQKPYDTKYRIPPNLQNDNEFTDYIKEKTRWGWWENLLGGSRYAVGAAALFCTTASTWKFVSTKDASNFGIATTILAFVYGLLEGSTRYFATKRKSFYRKAQDLVDQENLDAGLPVENQEETPSSSAVPMMNFGSQRFPTNAF